VTAAVDGRPLVAPDIDVVSPALFREGPWEAYRRLREETPIAWDPRHQIWVASRHADVVRISLDNELFCSSKGIRPEQSLDLSLIGLDEPEHTQRRRLINKGFTPRMVRNLEGRIRQVTAETLDRIATRGECDFVSDIAVPIPLIVIAELMGLPVEDRDRFWHWSDDMMGGADRMDPDDPAILVATEAFAAYTGHVGSIVKERTDAYRAAKAAGAAGTDAPALADDLISALVAANEEGILEQSDELQHDELIMFLVLLVVAGNETTRNAISGGMAAFAEFPDQWQLVLDHPEHLATLPDEIVRYVSPVISFARTATADTELRGEKVREGEKVVMLYQSANRDAEVFDAPDELRIDRSPNDHLAFGIGPHYCLGANLAKLEIRVLFEELARRFPDMRVPEGGGPTYGDTTLVHTVSSLPVVFTQEA